LSNASRAASIAFSASTRSPSATVAISVSVAGLVTEIAFSDSDSVHSPLIQSLYCVMRSISQLAASGCWEHSFWKCSPLLNFVTVLPKTISVWRQLVQAFRMLW